MKTRHLLLLILVLALPLGAGASEKNWNRIESQIIEESRLTQAAAADTLKLIKMDNQELAAELRRVSEALENAEQAYEKRKNQFQALVDEQAQLKEKIQSEAEEIQKVEDTVFNAAQKTHSLIVSSPVTPEHPERIQQLEPLMTKANFPGMEGVQTLVHIIWTEMTASGQIRKYSGSFVGPDFKKQKGDIVRIGSLCAIYGSEDSGTGYLRVGENKRFVAVTGEISWFAHRTLADYISGKARHLPVDVSGGTVFRVLSDQKTFADWVEAGGILIWPIFAVGAAALLLALERFFFLFRIRSNSDKIMRDIHTFIEQDNWDGARQYCNKNKRFPTCNVMGAVFEHLGVTREVLENAIQEAILRQIPRLERFVATLAILAAIAPLLGLLGTVTGMINTFQIITLFGTGDPKMMSGGISEALVTTQLGLAVAIPIMLMHHFLERRVDKILGEIEEKGNKITLTLIKKGAIAEGAEKGAV
jgi:biopolymer transport protein ExbB